ncbi:MAG: ABC transporter permease [Actinomycetota bacterium]
MSATRDLQAAEPASRWTPSIGRLAWRRFSLELRTFRRVHEEVVFTFALPILLLVLFASIFGGEIDDTGVDVSQYFVAGMIVSAGLTVGFQSLSAQLALERHDGSLKRLALTPMPAAAYMLGKVGMVAAIVAIQTVVMFTVGVAAFGVRLPSPSGLLLLTVVATLNLVIWTLLGLAFSRLIRTPRAGAAVTLPPALVLQFISGVYLVLDEIPAGLRTIASIFPLRWAALGARQALLPDSFASAEPGGSWQTPTMLAVLMAWACVSALLAAISFRWQAEA